VSRAGDPIEELEKVAEEMEALRGQGDGWDKKLQVMMMMDVVVVVVVVVESLRG
jgi:hypothetical protein